MTMVSYKLHAAPIKMCAKGTRAFLISHGMPKDMIQKFFLDAIQLEEFKKYVGDDAMAQQIIREALKDGRK